MVTKEVKYMDSFDEMFRDMKLFQKNFMEDVTRELEVINEAVRSGDLKGQWKVKEINQPNMKGYAIYGQFRSDMPLDPSKPFEPSWRPERPTRPLPKPPINLNEPLTDIFEGKKNFKLYIHMPGVAKDDIQLNISNGQAEVKAKSFQKTVKLPTENVDSKKINATCKNGVLEITIPKKKAAKDEKKQRIKIE
jgi:HSP20 family protein